MVDHPYKSQPDRAFWNRFVPSGSPFSVDGSGYLIKQSDRVASAGSCFAANIIPYLEKAGLNYVREERLPSVFSGELDDNFSYGKFSAAYGNIYTVRQLRQLLDRVDGKFHPKEDRWHVNGEVIDPFRPGLRYRAKTDREFDALTASHLGAVRRVFDEATTVIFTLGLTEAWRSRIDGAVYPACPGTVAGQFDPSLHEFYNFTVSDIIADLNYVAERLFRGRPEVRLIITVSPVPLVATATDSDVVVATVYSKSVLRAAAGEFVVTNARCFYFPAYEIITGPQAPQNFFEADRRNVSKIGVEAVMSVLLNSCEGSLNMWKSEKDHDHFAQQLSQKLQQAECEEEASEY